jgi:hypothetical protein
MLTALCKLRILNIEGTNLTNEQKCKSNTETMTKELQQSSGTSQALCCLTSCGITSTMYCSPSRPYIVVLTSFSCDYVYNNINIRLSDINTANIAKNEGHTKHIL